MSHRRQRAVPIRNAILAVSLLVLSILATNTLAQGSDEFVSCGGFIKPSSAVQKYLAGGKLDVSNLKVELLTKDSGAVRGDGVVTPSGYFIIPVYDQGSFVIRVKSPAGWHFSPAEYPVVVAGGKCNDEKDVHFELTGFTISGSVKSDGARCASGAVGVAGVQINLLSHDSNIISTVASNANGEFVFANIAPGSYRVASVEGNSDVAVVVEFGAVSLAAPLIVSKFDISGHVGEGSTAEAVRGVDVVLFGRADASVACGPAGELPVGMKTQLKGLAPLCKTQTDAAGQFRFSGVSCGAYTVVPHYRTSAGSVYDVSPASESVTVDNGNAVIKEPFRIRGFSVSGRVTAGPAKVGIAGVSVSLVGKDLTTTTDANGVFKFEQVEAGTYDLVAKKEKFSFSDARGVKITPATSKLPDLEVATVELCGRVFIPHPPAGVETTGRQVTLADAKAPKTILSRVTTEGSGGFYCFQAAPGKKYVVAPVISDSERRAGLILTSTEQTVELLDQPVNNINFAQSLLRVAGRVRCLQTPCDASIAVTLRADSSSNSKDSEAAVVTTGLVHDDAFVFQHVVPGKYVVSVDKPDWCWEQPDALIEIEVKKTDITELELVQTGYKMVVRAASNDVEIEYGVKNTKARIAAGSELAVCLPERGVYPVRVVSSCFNYGRPDNLFQYSSDSGAKPLVLQAKSFRLHGLIQVESLPEGVTASELLSDLSIFVGASKATIKALSPTSIAYSHWVDINSGDDHTVLVVPQAPKHNAVLFYPRSVRAKTNVASGDCPASQPMFSARAGVFLTGKVVPAAAGVKISAGDDVQTTTDASGHYKLGPLADDVEFELHAEAPGLFLKKEVESKHVVNFRSVRLGAAVVKVPGLAGVLISLSGSGYRNNTATNADGVVKFENLFPGDYFALPLLKEYAFEPQGGRAITVEEGAELIVEFTARRVAFSAFGFVRALNGQAERGLTVEAVSVDSSESRRSEETQTDESGNFRLRGLLPGKKYKLQLKTANTNNDRIERVAPESVEITIPAEGGDVSNIAFVAFRKPTGGAAAVAVRLTAQIVNTAQQSQEENDSILASLTVQLVDETNNVVQSRSLARGLDLADFVGVKPAAKYTLRTKSSLNPTNYNLKLDDVKVDIAGASSSSSSLFEIPIAVSAKQAGQEAPPSQVASLVFMVLVGAFVFYRKESINFVWKTVLKREGEPAIGDSLENVVKSLQQWLQARRANRK